MMLYNCSQCRASYDANHVRQDGLCPRCAHGQGLCNYCGEDAAELRLKIKRLTVRLNKALLATKLNPGGE
jgi:hypothetical protein